MRLTKNFALVVVVVVVVVRGLAWLGLVDGAAHASSPTTGMTRRLSYFSQQQQQRRDYDCMDERGRSRNQWLHRRKGSTHHKQTLEMQTEKSEN
jgi:hypothetical protein